MRTKNIQVSMKIPFPFGKSDDNGVAYTREAIEKAIPTFSNVPIVSHLNGDKPHIIGIVDYNDPTTEWDEENGVCNLTVNGLLFRGGTECSIVLNDNKVVTHMSIQSIGISD